MATDWSTPASIASNTWKSKITSPSSGVDFKHVAEAPENLLLTPEDFEIVPEEVQSDKEDWAITSIPPDDSGQWTVVTGEND
jgi:hypothetical protein